MERINGATKQTDNRFLNLYELQAIQRNGTEFPYQVASRAKTAKDLKAISGKNEPDAVAVFATCENKLVLIRQFRYPLGDYIYELPAGLVDEGETMHDAVIREMREETGLEFVPDERQLCFGNPWYSSPGMTDESCAIVVGKCSGQPTNTNQEESEDIEVVLADVYECYRILKEEKVDMKAAWAMIMMIVADKNI